MRPAQVQYRAVVGVERGLDGGVRGEVDVQGLALALRTDLACMGRRGEKEVRRVGGNTSRSSERDLEAVAESSGGAHDEAGFGA